MWRSVLLLVAACNQVYGLDSTKQRDAGVLADRDGDGVGDAEDNCLDRANANQRDTDGDLRGDVCDECPLLRRTSGDADGDGVGDACDPQPTLARECLTVLETFSDASTFTANWTVAKTQPISTVAIEDGKAVVKPNMDGATVTLTEMSTVGQHGSVLILGRVLGRDPAVAAFAGMTGGNFYGCRLQATSITTDVFGQSIEPVTPLIPQPTIGDRFTIRLDTVRDMPITVLCRVDLGTSVAARAQGSQVGTGPSGILVASEAAEIDAVAFVGSRDASGLPCSTEYR